MDQERRTRFLDARRDPTLAVLEGFHALKHALRFGAEVVEAVAETTAPLEDLAASLAPELRDRLTALLARAPAEEVAALSPRPHPTGVIALARRPEVDVRAVLADPSPAPLVLLEAPRRLENVGAAIRVAAAAGATGVLTTGEADPWHPVAIRAAAGLHYAVPVARVDALPSTDRPLVALDPAGEPFGPDAVPPRAILAFGTEREGLGADLRSRASALVRIPMREGVSSLNLATAVAAALYALSQKE